MEMEEVGHRAVNHAIERIGERAADDEAQGSSGKGLPGNHSLQESAPKETLAELQQFLRG